MAGWVDRLAQPFSQPSMFKIEFIRHIDGRAEREVMHTIEGLFLDLYAATDQGNRLWPSIHNARGAVGFRVAQGDGPWIAHRFRGDSRLHRDRSL
jgi:hypothetical protein